MLKESSLPDHPMDPFIRILGEVIDHRVARGDYVRWRIATQTVIPRGSTETLIREVAVVDEAGHEVFVAPGLEIPPREPDLTRFDNQGAFLDCAYEPVIDTEALEPGNYLVRTKLTSRSGAEIAGAELLVQTGRNAKLLHRIEGIPKGKGMVRVGDVDGDGIDHGEVGDRTTVAQKIDLIRSRSWFAERPRPIVFNESDGALAFEAAVKRGVSFGLHSDCFQTMWPPKWGIWENDILWFFRKVKGLTGAPGTEWHQK